MHPAPFPPDRCPLCGAPNACAMDLQQRTGQPQGPCWCTQVDFGSELLAHVPAQAQRKACICAACAAAAASGPAIPAAARPGGDPGLAESGG